MFIARESAFHERGTWKELLIGKNGLKSATFTCPLCGTTGTLEDHEITGSGEVSPSVQCMTEKCEFHRHVMLSGWDPLRKRDYRPGPRKV